MVNKCRVFTCAKRPFEFLQFSRCHWTLRFASNKEQCSANLTTRSCVQPYSRRIRSNEARSPRGSSSSSLPHRSPSATSLRTKMRQERRIVNASSENPSPFTSRFAVSCCVPAWSGRFRYGHLSLGTLAAEARAVRVIRFDSRDWRGADARIVIMLLRRWTGRRHPPLQETLTGHCGSYRRHPMTPTNAKRQ